MVTDSGGWAVRGDGISLKEYGTIPYMSDKQHAVELLERLGPGQLAAVVHLLETMVSGEEEGDTLSPAEAKALAEADEWSRHNEPIPPEQVLAEFGLTMADW